MNRYKYKAINSDGKYVYGKISADNQGELEVLLKESALDLISCAAEKESIFEGGLKAKELIAIFSHLAQLNKAGVSIVDSISDVKDSADSVRVRNLMQELHEALRNGSLLSEAIAKHPKIFSRVFIGLIATGEKTGNLHNAFHSIVDHLKWSSEMKRKTVKAVRYPLFTICVMFVVMGVMTAVVVPKVTDFLKTQDIALPAVTKSLIAFSNFTQSHGIAIVISIPLIWITYKIIYRMPGMALVLDGVKLRIPVFGSIISKIDSSRFCHFFSVTFKSGLGVLECLEAARDVVNNKAIKASIEIIEKQVADGQRLGRAIAYTKRFPNLVVRMFDLGEASGNMEEALDNIRFFYDQEINDAIDRMVGMIQPALTLIMGGMMAWITIAVFGPIYSSFSKM